MQLADRGALIVAAVEIVGIAAVVLVSQLMTYRTSIGQWVARHGLSLGTFVAVLFLVALGTSMDPGASRIALSRLSVRFLDAASPRFVIGIVVGVIAFRAWIVPLSSTKKGLSTPVRFSRHWGGLGGGEGGWYFEVDPEAARTALYVLCALSLTVVSATLLYANEREANSPVQPHASASAKPEAKAVACKEPTRAPSEAADASLFGSVATASSRASLGADAGE